MAIPRHTDEIFDLLSKGKFICSNSPDQSVARLYNTIDENYDDLYTYFSAIGFYLEKGDEYFHFSRREAKANIESKLEQAYRWIDLLDFFKDFNNGFGPGFRFTPSDILLQVKTNASLKDKLEGMKRLTGDGNYADRVQKLIDYACSQGFTEIENDITQQYKVLTAFKYMEQLLVSIVVADDTTDEISK